MIVGAVPLSSSRLSSSSRLGRRPALRREFWCAVRLVCCFPKSRRSLFHFISLPSAISRHLSSLAVSSLVVSESPSGFCQKAKKDAELDSQRSSCKGTRCPSLFRCTIKTKLERETIARLRPSRDAPSSLFRLQIPKSPRAGLGRLQIRKRPYQVCRLQ